MNKLLVLAALIAAASAKAKTTYAEALIPCWNVTGSVWKSDNNNNGITYSKGKKDYDAVFEVMFSNGDYCDFITSGDWSLTYTGNMSLLYAFVGAWKENSKGLCNGTYGYT